MSETNIPKAAEETGKAASSASHAVEKMENAGGFGEKAKKVFDAAEHVHFAYEIGGVLFTALPAAILKVWQMIAGAASVVGGATVSFWNLLVLTAPLTLAVAVIAICLRRDWFSDTPIIRFPFAGIVLVLAAYLSNWSGVGKAFNGADVVLRSQWFGSNSTVNTIFEWFRLPYFALGQYYRVYGFWPFALSVVVGIWMGSRVKERTAAATS